jgi:hypothetical protein
MRELPHPCSNISPTRNLERNMLSGFETGDMMCEFSNLEEEELRRV